MRMYGMIRNCIKIVLPRTNLLKITKSIKMHFNLFDINYET